MTVTLHIRSPKMTSSQYAPLTVPIAELQGTIEKYESYGYSVTIIKKEGK